VTERPLKFGLLIKEACPMHSCVIGRCQWLPDGAKANHCGYEWDELNFIQFPAQSKFDITWTIVSPIVHVGCFFFAESASGSPFA